MRHLAQNRLFINNSPDCFQHNTEPHTLYHIKHVVYSFRRQMSLGLHAFVQFPTVQLGTNLSTL